MWIEFSSIPAYTIYALSNPSRIIVDLENTAFEDHLSFPMQVDIGPIAYIKGREYSTRQPVLARLAVYLQGERPDIEVAEEDYEVLIFIPKPPQAEPEQEETAPEEENQQKEEYQPEETAPKSPESAAGPEVAQEEQKTGDSPKTADQTASLPPEVPKEEPPLSQTAELPTTPLPAEDAAQTASTSAPQEPEIEDKIVEEIIEEKEIDSMELETGKGEVAALPIPDSVPEKPAGKQETENKPALPLPVAATEKKAVATPKKEPVRIILATKKKRAAPKIVPLPQTSPPALAEKK
ncbi:MAG: AMIN domain-containing protein, partial [Desulfobulbaceae bacterium]|nr:AMIN domain-containing protein [Desulfobulbaceae bacterium]